MRSKFQNQYDDITRREALWKCGGGLGGLALTSMLSGDNALAADATPTTLARARGGVLEVMHVPPRATRVVQFFMAGAASHVDLFDYKPELVKRHGQPWDPGEKVELFQNGHGATFAPPWAWKQYGQ